MKPFRIIISLQAKKSLKDICAYIRKESPSAAKKVRKTLLDLIKSLSDSPEKYSIEPFLEHKKMNHRSVHKWHYKIVYRCTEKEVVILDIIHTSRDTEIIRQVD